MKRFIPLPDSYYIHPRHLAMFRIVYCSVLIFFVGLYSFVWLGGNISTFFFPPKISVAALFDGFPGILFFTALSIINLIAFFGMFWGFWCKWASVVFSITAIIGYNFMYSFGKIDHTLLYLITPLFLAFSGWGNYYSIDEIRNRRKGKPETVAAERVDILISLLALSIGFSMFTAGFQKILGGWLNWNAEAVKGHLFDNYFVYSRNKLLANELMKLDNHFVWKLMDYSTLVFEVGFLFSAFRRKIFNYFLGAAVFFHLFILLTFNIAFASNLIAYAVFFDWKALANYIKSKGGAFVYKYKGAVLRSLFLLSCIVFAGWILFLQYGAVQRLPSVYGLILHYGFQVENYEEIAIYSLIFLSPLILMLGIYLHVIRKPSAPEQVKALKVNREQLVVDAS